MISGNPHATARMEEFLREKVDSRATLDEALEVAVEAWAIGHSTQEESEQREEPSEAAAKAYFTEQSESLAIEAAVLDRTARLPATWRALPEAEVRESLRHRLA